MDVVPVILEGKTVRLEPLRFSHATSLAQHADPDLFSFFAGYCPEDMTEEACRDYIRLRMETDAISFAMVLKSTDQAVGHTSFMDIRPSDRSLEIGSTWIGRAHHGTAVNAECKFLMLQHAFENLGCVRVQLKTDERNKHSRAAIEKLGAKFEGILRKHMILHDGYIRNSAMYSITDDEWPAVKERCLNRLSAMNH